MPRANPEGSFDASARHLFRHITDAKALRRNPLARTYFAGESGGRATLKTFHAEILRIADALGEQLRAQGRRTQAARQREIVAALCAGEDSAQTAARLKISRSHYYRERHAICNGIAQALKRANQPHDTRFAVGDDPLWLLFSRAESLRDAGRSHEAVRLLEDAHQRIADDFTKSTVSLGLAEELVFLGQRERARELLGRSRHLSEQQERVASEWLHDTWALNAARLESQLSGEADAGRALELIAKRRIAARRSDDVTLDAVFLTGEWYRSCGRYEAARAMLRRLQAMDARYLNAVPKRRIATLLLAAWCAENGTDELDVVEQSLRDALELAISGGTVVGALLAMAGLVRHEAAHGRDGAAYAMAHEAVRAAQGVDFNGFLGFVGVEIIGALLQTRYWRAVDPLLFEIERLAAPGTLATLKHEQATFLLRTGRRETAAELMGEALALARRLGNKRAEALILRDRALAFSDAELMRDAITLVERHGSKDDLSQTYDVATRLLRDRRSLRLARQARESKPAVKGVREVVRVEPLRLLASLRP